MKNIENLFNKLNIENIPYDESYWNEMEKLLNKKKRNKRIFISVLLAITLFLSFSLILNFKNKYKSTITVNKINETGSVITKRETIKNPKNSEKYSSINDNLVNKIKNKIFAKKFIFNNNFTFNSITSHKNSMFKYNYEVKGKNLNITTDDFFNIKPVELKIIKREDTSNIDSFDSIYTEFRSAYNLKIRKWSHFIVPKLSYNRNIKPRFKNEELLFYKNTETFKNTISFGFDYFIKKRNIIIGIGIAYNSINIKTNYIEKITKYNFDTSLIMINPNYSTTSTGTRIALLKNKIDTSTNQYLQAVNPSNFAQLNYLQIPIYFQYEIKIKKFNLFIETGLNTMFLMKSKGEYLNISNENYSFNSLKNSNNISKVLYSYQFSSGLKYNVHKKVNLFTSLGYNSSLNSMIKSYRQVKSQNMLTIGIEYCIK